MADISIMTNDILSNINGIPNTHFGDKQKLKYIRGVYMNSISTDYISVPDSNSLDLSTNGYICVRYLQPRLPSPGTQGYNNLISKYHSGPSQGYIIQRTTGSYKMNCYIANGTLAKHYYNDTAGLNFIAYGFDGTYLYKNHWVNKQLRNMTTTVHELSPPCVATTDNLNISQGNPTGYPATVFEVIIFNSTLTFQNAKQLMNESLKPTDFSPNCMMWHDYRTGSANDLSGNSNNGTLYGKAAFATVSWEDA